MKAEDVNEIIEKDIIGGQVVERLLYVDPITKEIATRAEEYSFYKKQQRIALYGCGVINPENINAAIGYDGMQAMAKVLTTMTPQDVINEMLLSGLRGRGGGGFPTGKKWQFAHDIKSDVKYVVCNGDEGDPGAFMDRAILEDNPFSVLEGMMIAGYAIGAHDGYVYVRAEYPLAVEHLKTIIASANEIGLLGDNILNSGFNFQVHIRLGAGAFVCG
ncbi:MAG TPA: NADH-quinone oxidoreductase subunit L, partial [Sedimentisphaerales bacterium]